MPAEMFSGLMSSSGFCLSRDEVDEEETVETEVSVVFQYWLPTAHQGSERRCQVYIDEEYV